MKELMNAYSAAQTDFHSRMAQRLLEILAAYMPSLRYHNTFTSLVNSTPNSAVAPNQLLPSGLPPLPTVEFEDPSSYQNLSKLLTITEKEVNTLRAKIATCLKDYIDENGGIKNGTTYIWSICKDAKESEDPLSLRLSTILKNFFDQTSTASMDNPPDFKSGLFSGLVTIENHGRMYLSYFMHDDDSSDLKPSRYAGCLTERDLQYPLCRPDVVAENGFTLLHSARLQRDPQRIVLFESSSNGVPSLQTVLDTITKRLAPIEFNFEEECKNYIKDTRPETLARWERRNIDIESRVQAEVQKKYNKLMITDAERDHLEHICKNIRQLQEQGYDIAKLSSFAMLIPETEWPVFCNIFPQRDDSIAIITNDQKNNTQKIQELYDQVQNICTINLTSVFSSNPRMNLTFHRLHPNHDFPTDFVDTHIPNCWQASGVDLKTMRMNGLVLESIEDQPIRVYLADKRGTLYEGGVEVNPGDVVIVAHNKFFPNSPNHYVLEGHSSAKKYIPNLALLSTGTAIKPNECELK